MSSNVSVAQATMSETVLPERVQEALGQLIEAAKEGLLALSVGRHGHEVLRPRERRRPKMPNQLSTMVEEQILSFSIAHPRLGPKRVGISTPGPGTINRIAFEEGAIAAGSRAGGRQVETRIAAGRIAYRARRAWVPSRRPSRRLTRTSAARMAGLATAAAGRDGWCYGRAR